MTFKSGGQTTLTLTDATDARISGSARLRVDTFAPPTVALTEPANGARVSGTVTLIARGTVALGTTVASLVILVDGKPLAQGTESLLSTTWDSDSAAQGEHTLTAVLTDSAGNSTTSAPVVVTTQGGGGCGCGATSGADAGLWVGLLALGRLLAARRRDARGA